MWKILLETQGKRRKTKSTKYYRILSRRANVRADADSELLGKTGVVVLVVVDVVVDEVARRPRTTTTTMTTITMTTITTTIIITTTTINPPRPGLLLP